MSKILINTTASIVFVADTGISIPASGSYTIPPQDYLYWSSSSNTVTFVGNGTLIVNDGSSNLSISDGIDWIKDIFPKKIGVQDGSNQDITSTVVGATRGLDMAPNKYAPSLASSAALAALNAALTANNLDGYGTAGVAITGTWVGTLSFQGSIDGTNFFSIIAQPENIGILATTCTTNGSWLLNITGLKSVRAIMTSYTSGSATIALSLTPYAGFLRSLSTIAGGTDGTPIGNVSDRIKVDAIVTVTPAPSTFATIYRRQEITVPSKVETDLPSGSYTVPAGKTFVLASLQANYDTQSPLVIRLKKQTGGAGSFVTEFRLTLKQHGQDNSNVQFTFPYGIQLGTAGDVIKLTYESALSKGSLWASFTGVEY